MPLLLRSGAGGLAWRRSVDGAAPAPVQSSLREVHRAHHIRGALQEHDLERLFAALAAAGIDALLGKGWVSGRAYAEPGARPCGDMDVYVDVPQGDSAARAVAAAKTHGVLVDLHRGLGLLDDRTFADVYARGRTFPLGRTVVRGFGPEDHLRLMALHMLGHGAWRPLWLCDVAAALETRTAAFDWTTAMAGDARRTEWLGLALRLAGELLGADLGGVPPQALGPTLPAWVAPAVLRAWGAREFEPHGDRLPLAEMARAGLRHPGQLLRALRVRWPNAIEATIGRRARFDHRARLPVQVREYAARALGFLRRRPARH